MRLLLALFASLLFSIPAHADGLSGIVTLAADDQAALAQVKASPDRHVVLYFGDHAN